MRTDGGRRHSLISKHIPTSKEKCCNGLALHERGNRMDDKSTAGRWIFGASVVLAFLIVLGAMALSLYLLVDHHARPQDEDALQALRRQQDEASRHIEQLQHPVQTPDKQDTATAYQQDLKQHELLLNEFRSERSEAEEQIKYASDLLKEVKETEDRTRSAAALFLGIFGAIATILLGQNYWQFRGWKEKADQSLDDIKGVKPDIDLIRETRARLESRLPKYIEDVQHDLMELKFPTGPALAKMHEIDHLAYLSNTEMRFKEGRTDEEANQYLLALLEAARGHVFQKNYYGVEDRLQEFFRTVLQYPDAVEKHDKARAHSLRAFVHYRLLALIASTPPWIRNSRTRETDEWRQLAFAEVKKSQECDKEWWHSYFIEALLYSYMPEYVVDQKNIDTFLAGQRKAIAVYRKLIARGPGGTPDMAAWQNLACCLKRVADITGQTVDYEKFKLELKRFPIDEQIRQGFVENGRSETEGIFLWQDMLQDEELFAKLDQINADDYRSFWGTLLADKVTMRDWQKDLQEIKKRAPKMAGWVL
jgi:hypothetical protein